MSAAKTNGQKDWTHLLTDPELVGHIGKLLQAYREAPAEKREEALLRAMREIRQAAVASGGAGTKTSDSTARIAVQSTSTTASAAAAAAKTLAEKAKTVDEISVELNQPNPVAEVPVARAKTTEPEANAKPAEAKSLPPPAMQPPFVPDIFTPSFGQDRRHYPRIRCFIAVELRCEGWEAPVWGNLANVSTGGCYIETVEPIRKHTKLEIGLWANNGKVWVKGIVINGVVTENNPTFGVRLQYSDMDPGGRETLRFFLKFVEDTSKNYEKQHGYLAQLKR